MASWTELVTEFQTIGANENPEAAGKKRGEWINNSLQAELRKIAAKRGNRNILFYASAFLQKPGLPGQLTQITHEDINGFMATLHDMQWDKNLTLILHTPGGVTNATESIVEYLHDKFKDIEVIVPAFAMSAGTMISLGANRVVMGRQSQLGPIDPQMPLSGGMVSARAIVDQFEEAKREITTDLKLAHVWAPILQSLGPARLVEAKNALGYGERMVAGWLTERMFAGKPNTKKLAQKTAKYFNDASTHMSHGRRISREEAADNHVTIEELEADQELQDAVLTAYHLVTIMIENSPTCKMIVSSHGKTWLKNHGR